MKLLPIILSLSLLVPTNSLAMAQKEAPLQYSWVYTLGIIASLSAMVTVGTIYHLETVERATAKGYENGLSACGYNKIVQGGESARDAFIDAYAFAYKKECGEAPVLKRQTIHRLGKQAGRKACALKKCKKKSKK